jgi:hypothetical protein
MTFKLKSVPGFADLPDSTLDAEQFAIGLNIARINDNSEFGMVRPEFFYGRYKNGDTVNLPVSDVDGYRYSREELTYQWGIYSTVNPETGWIAGPGALWFAGWKVDQETGEVSTIEWYRKSEGNVLENSGTSNDGVLSVVTIAQRLKTTMAMAQVPAYSDLPDSDFVIDDALATTKAKTLNRNAKYAISNFEVIYLGEYYDGQTVPLAVSPIDGYTYPRGETRYQLSWRWTTVGTAFTQPDASKGQLHRISASVNPATGQVTTEVLFYNSGVITTNFGRVAVFAFCQRSQADVYQVTIPGTTMPWEFPGGGVNSAFDYGRKNGTAPILLPAPIAEGQQIQIDYLDGTIRVSPARAYYDAAGEADYNTTTAGGSTGTGFPGAYLGGVGRLGDLIYAFVVRRNGASNRRRPNVGLSATWTVPAGADAIPVRRRRRQLLGQRRDRSRSRIRVGEPTSAGMGDAQPARPHDRRVVVFSTGELELSTLWRGARRRRQHRRRRPEAQRKRGILRTPGHPGTFST